MRPGELILRCFVQRIDDQQWEAFCLDLNLAAQAESLKDAKVKLENMVKSYLYDALVGEDKEHANELLTRRAPADLWLKYYWLKLRLQMRKTFAHSQMPRKAMLYRKAMPLIPAPC